MMTNERLREIRGSAFALKSMTESEQIQIIDELLALRSLRDAGDDNQLIVQLAGCLCAAEGATDNPAKQGDYGWSLAYQKTLELHQQLREAREEIERLNRSYRSLESQWLHEKENVEWQKTKVRNLRISADAAGRVDLKSQIATLTEENKQLHDEAEVSDSLVLTLQEEVKTLTAERDEARKLLSELHSAPEMKEVDALGTALLDVIQTISNRYGIGVAGVNATRRAKDVIAIARRAIVSREEEKQRADEVAGLLKWWVSFKDGFGQLEGMSAGSAVEEWKDNARRILEIVEGK